MSDELLLCDLVHEGAVRGTWALIGEAGDYLLCDEHYEMAGRPAGWHRRQEVE